MGYGWKITLNDIDISDKIDGFSITGSLSNFCREMTLAFAEASYYSSFDFTQISEAPEIEIFTKISDTWYSQGKFFIERPALVSAVNSETMQGVWGRSLTALLADPFSVKVTKVWETQTTFYSICEEMCDLAGFTWDSSYSDIDDFVIYPYTYEADGLYPIDVITELAMLAGAVVTSDRLNHLCIKQVNYSPSSEDLTITDADISTIEESPEWPVFANRVRITPVGSLASYSIDLVVPDQCLHADNSSKVKIFAQVRDPDGNPVDGIVVSWSHDSNTASFANESTNTQEILIQNERQSATGFHSFKTNLPVSSITGVWAYTDTGKTVNLASDGYTIDGNTVTLTRKLAYCDQSLIISYRSAGIATNFLQAGFAADDVTITADIEGQRDSEIIYIENPCQCPPTLRLSASPTSIVRNEIAKLLVYVEESGPVTTGRVVFMSESTKVKKGQLSWTTAKLGQVQISKEKTKARNEIAGLTQCEIGMFPASVTSVYRTDEDGNPTGTNLYSSYEGKTINLSTYLATETDLLVTYTAQGAAINLFTGDRIGLANVSAYIVTTSQESKEDQVEIQVTDKSQITDNYPPGWDQGDDDGDYGGVGGDFGEGWEDTSTASLCRQSDGTNVECSSGERCCYNGDVVGCFPDSECVGGDVDPCWPASIDGEPNQSILWSRFDTGLEYGCTCSEMCANEFEVSDTTQGYDGGSGKNVSDLALAACGCEEGSAEYWEKYAELKAEALAQCEEECQCSTGLEWDTDNSPETIVAGGDIDIFVIGGIAEYQWSVSGNGYSLASDVTQIGANRLTCAEGSCETDYDVTVTVTVEDGCGNTASATIRNTSGHWEEISRCGNLDGAQKVCIIGDYRYTDDWCCQKDNTCEGDGCGHYCGASVLTCDDGSPNDYIEGNIVEQWTCQ